MDIIGNSDLTSQIASSTTNIVGDLTPIIVVILGIFLAFFVLQWLIDLFYNLNRKDEDEEENEEENESDFRIKRYWAYRDKYGQEEADKKYITNKEGYDGF